MKISDAAEFFSDKRNKNWEKQKQIDI